MKVPPEILNKIFKNAESNPANVRSFGKFMSTKTKAKMLNCKKVIDTGNINNVRLLKFHDVKCSKNDLLHAIDKGFFIIAKYIHNSSLYPEASINYTDIMNALLDNNNRHLHMMLKIYKFNGIYEYYTLWSLINAEHKHLMRTLLDFKPIKQPIELSILFEDALNFMVVSSGNYLKNLMSIAKNDIIVDEAFLIKILNSREFEIAKDLSFYSQLSNNTKRKLLKIAIDTNDQELISYLVNYQKVSSLI